MQLFFFSDEDISGDHLLAEARVNLVKIFPQMQKQFQVCLHKPTFKVRREKRISMILITSSMTLHHLPGWGGRLHCGSQLRQDWAQPRILLPARDTQGGRVDHFVKIPSHHWAKSLSIGLSPSTASSSFLLNWIFTDSSLHNSSCRCQHCSTLVVQRCFILSLTFNVTNCHLSCVDAVI